jgi:hypothetical protein
MSQNIVQHGGYTKYVDAFASTRRHGHTRNLQSFRANAVALDAITQAGMSPFDPRYEELAMAFYGYDHGLRYGNWAYLDRATREKSLVSAEAEAAMVSDVKLHINVRKYGALDFGPHGTHHHRGGHHGGAVSDDDDDEEAGSHGRSHPPSFYVGGQPRVPATKNSRESKNTVGAGANSSAQSGNDRS